MIDKSTNLPIENKWQKFWEEQGFFAAKESSGKDKYYLLFEFPYPSGAGLHVGHPRPYVGTDVLARQARMLGKNVLFPMGWDAFGLPTENYAIKNKIHPRVATDQNIKTFKRQIKSIGISVYLGQRRGNASTSDFSPQAIRDTVRAAYDIARFTAEDDFAGLPDAADLALDAAQRPDLDLFHPWTVDAAQAADIALRCEAAALSVDKRITNSEGGAVSAQQSHFFSAHSRGFRGG